MNLDSTVDAEKMFCKFFIQQVHSVSTSQQQNARQQKVNSVTLTAILVTSSFIVLITPPVAITFIGFPEMKPGMTLKELYDAEITYTIADMLNTFAYFNYCINFYIYILTGSRFRREFFNIVYAPVSVVKRRWK